MGLPLFSRFPSLICFLLDSIKQRYSSGSILSKDPATRLGWELSHQPCDRGRRKKRRSESLSHAADKLFSSEVFYLVYLSTHFDFKGKLSTSESLDREMTSQYHLSATATDGGGKSCQSQVRMRKKFKFAAVLKK